MTDVTIAAQVDEMKKSAPAEPDTPMAAFPREQAVLAQAAPLEGVAAVGTRFPDAELLDVDGTSRSLSGVVGEGPSVLVLYRGAWCPYCNIALRTYQRVLLPALRERGVELIAISPQKPDGSLTMQEKHGLEYAVLSDPGLVLARAAGVVTEPGEEGLAAQLELGLDLREVNADATAALPMPTVAIFDGGLTLRWIDVHRDYSTRTEPDEVLAALDAFGEPT
ncbi:MAG: peroxiredoxin-like family protein [Solirubrobacterales bacterium]